MLLDRRRVLDRPRIRIIALHSDHVIILGLSVSAVVSWDTPKFVAPNRTHLSHSGQVDGWTSRMDPSEIVEDPTGKRNIGRDLTHTGLYVIDSDRASSFSVIPSAHPDNSIIPTSGGVSSSDLATGQLIQPLTRVADIQINATGGDATEQTSIQIRRGSTATDSPPVEDDVEQFSAHEREELTETGISREGRPIVPSS